MVGPDASAVVRSTVVYLLDLFCSDTVEYLSLLYLLFKILLSTYLWFISFLYLDLYVLGDDTLIC